MTRLILSVLFAFIFVGCGGSDSTNVTIQPQQAGAYIVFDSVNSNIPYPNNILFAGSTDGTLNIPYEESDADASVKFALNALDGFSTTSPITIGFDGEIDAKSLYGNIHLYELGATGVVRELKFHVPGVVVGEYVATTTANKIVILPVKPLDGGKNYGVVLTKGIVDNSNNPIAPDVASEMLLSVTPLVAGGVNFTKLDYADAVKFEGIRQLSQQVISATLAYDNTISRADIVSAWSFKTQSIGKVFDAIKDADKSAILVGMTDTNLTTSFIGAAGYSNIWVGALANLPYYLDKPSATNPTAPLTTYFSDANGSEVFSGLPHEKSKQTIPVLMTIPNISTKPASGWPVVIFQHGITQNRSNLLAIADAFSSAGYASIAIDLPLHGITDKTNPLYQATRERTFDVDYIDNATHAPGPDGKIDDSGTHYINLASLLTSRDNLRQSASDLLALKNALATLSGDVDVDESRVAFVGHSLGTIASFGFLSKTPMESVTFAMPGGGIAELLNNSASFGPIIEAGLASKGIMKGSSDYAAFMLATQTVIDDADPINYAITVGGLQNIFAIEVVGNGTEGTDDQVIPNSVATAPLAGTEPLLTYMGTLNLTDTAGVKPNQAARFTVGGHSSILDPSLSMAATVEMQTQTASFVGSKGTAIKVTDKSLLYNP
jgi:dienelactone hydrolase